MLIEIILIMTPFLIGLAQVFFKLDAVYKFTEDFDEWIDNKYKNVLEGGNKIARYTLMPLYSLFITINDLTGNISDIWLQSGIRIASYIYLLGILLLLFLTFGYVLLIIALLVVCALIAVLGLRSVLQNRKEAKSLEVLSRHSDEVSQTFVENIWPFIKSETAKDEVAHLFDVQKIEVDYKGRIFENEFSPLPDEMKIGCFDKKGDIYDTRMGCFEKIGTIDTHGTIIDARENEKSPPGGRMSG
ncbi:MAG: hypothetical protein PVH84_11095 [Candidatus Aminicenantes bacterium]|jgi:hypothetical protein